jgi:hypothetical protein
MEKHGLKFTKGPRLFESDVEMMKVKKGVSTPGPSAYAILESKFLPQIGKEGKFSIE